MVTFDGLARIYINTIVFMICLDYVLQMPIDLIKENGFILKKNKKTDIPLKLW